MFLLSSFLRWLMKLFRSVVEYFSEIQKLPQNYQQDAVHSLVPCLTLVQFLASSVGALGGGVGDGRVEAPFISLHL